MKVTIPNRGYIPMVNGEWKSITVFLKDDANDSSSVTFRFPQWLSKFIVSEIELAIYTAKAEALSQVRKAIGL
jgi:hypothetical protein